LFLRLDFLASPSFDQFSQSFPGKFAILGLGTGILNSDAEASRQMAKRDGGRDLVYVLPSRSTGARKRFLQVGLAQHEVAGLVGASRASVARALASLRTLDIVATGRGTITVLDLDALRRIVA